MEIKSPTEATPELEGLLPTDHGPHLDPIAVTDTSGSLRSTCLLWVTVSEVLVCSHVSPLCGPELRCGK